MHFVFGYWYLWIIGLIFFPLFAVLPQLKNIHYAVDAPKDDPEAAKRFLQPVPLVLSVVGGMGTFVCLILFVAAVILAIIQGIKS